MFAADAEEPLTVTVRLYKAGMVMNNKVMEHNTQSPTYRTQPYSLK